MISEKCHGVYYAELCTTAVNIIFCCSPENLNFLLMFSRVALMFLFYDVFCTGGAGGIPKWMLIGVLFAIVILVLILTRDSIKKCVW